MKNHAEHYTLTSVMDALAAERDALQQQLDWVVKMTEADHD